MYGNWKWENDDEQVDGYPIARPMARPDLAYLEDHPRWYNGGYNHSYNPFLDGITLLNGDLLTVVINQLLSGMILQVVGEIQKDHLHCGQQFRCVKYHDFIFL